MHTASLFITILNDPLFSHVSKYMPQIDFERNYRVALPYALEVLTIGLLKVIEQHRIYSKPNEDGALVPSLEDEALPFGNIL